MRDPGFMSAVLPVRVKPQLGHNWPFGNIVRILRDGNNHCFELSQHIYLGSVETVIKPL